MKKVLIEESLLKAILEAVEDLHRTGDTQVFDMYAAPELIPALRQALSNEALNKMAQNAREIGLDYEHPTQYWRAYASDYERGVIDGMQKQMQSSVDRAVNAMAEQPAQQEPKRWAVFCQGCRKEWSVSYPHPGKSICADCDDKLAEQPAQHRAWFTVDELNAWADKKLKENPQWEEQPAQVDPCIDGSCSCCWANLDEQPAQQEPVAMQVRPSEFAQIIKGKEKVTGIPAYWAEWPSKEQP